MSAGLKVTRRDSSAAKILAVPTSSVKLDALQGKLFDEAEMDVAITQIKGTLDEERAQRVAKQTAEKQTRAASRSSEDRPRRKPLSDQLNKVQLC